MLYWISVFLTLSAATLSYERDSSILLYLSVANIVIGLWATGIVHNFSSTGDMPPSYACGTIIFSTFAGFGLFISAIIIF